MVYVKQHLRTSRKGRTGEVRAHNRKITEKMNVNAKNKVKSPPFISVRKGSGSASFDFENDSISFDDFGWNWNGTISEDLPLAFFRGINSTMKDLFLTEFESNLTWIQFKNYFKSAMTKESGLYGLSGDNARWKFGDDFIESRWDDEKNELIQAGFSEEVAEEILTKASSNSKVNDFDEFEKDFKADFKNELTSTINRSTSIRNFVDKLVDLKSDLEEDIFEWQSNKFLAKIMLHSELKRKSDLEEIKKKKR